MKPTIRTNNDKFFDVIRVAGIKHNSQSWVDYEKAKKLIPAGTGDSYEKYVRYITNYLGL